MSDIPDHPRVEALESPVEIRISGVPVTWGSGAVSGDYQGWILDIREAVSKHPNRERLARWLSSERERLGIEITFWLPPKRESDLDNLLDTIFNAFLDGACPEIPQQQRRRLDSKFITALVKKVITNGQSRTVIIVYPVIQRRPKESVGEIL
jgi:hypothetical protein